MSVYISLLKGTYDAILPWPFRKTMIFTLIDQQENELNANNVARIFTPDSANPGFARPLDSNRTLTVVPVMDFLSLFLTNNSEVGVTL